MQSQVNILGGLVEARIRRLRRDHERQLRDCRRAANLAVSNAGFASRAERLRRAWAVSSIMTHGPSRPAELLEAIRGVLRDIEGDGPIAA